jgi:hypothetical protein
LREFFPAALKAFDELNAPESLQLPRLAAYPDTAARLTRRQFVAGLAKAQPRAPEAGTDRIQAIPRADCREETNTASRAS